MLNASSVKEIYIYIYINVKKSIYSILCILLVCLTLTYFCEHFCVSLHVSAALVNSIKQLH